MIPSTVKKINVKKKYHQKIISKAHKIHGWIKIFSKIGSKIYLNFQERIIKDYHNQKNNFYRESYVLPDETYL